jgi:hypothetical protein
MMESSAIGCESSGKGCVDAGGHKNLTAQINIRAGWIQAEYY